LGESGCPVLRSNTEMVLPIRLVDQTLSSAETAMPQPVLSTPPPRKPVTIGESGRPFGANFETPPPNCSKMVVCEPAMKLLFAHMLPSPSMAMPPTPE